MAVAHPPPTRSREGIEYVDTGSGPPVLVVHGSPGGHDQGIACGRFLTDAGFRVIAPSRPGYLGTPLELGRTPAEQADRFAELLSELGLDRVGVFCWSGGGPSAYRLAVRHPDRVTGLVAAAAVSSRFSFAPSTVDEKLIMGTGLGRGLLTLLAHASPEQLISATIAAEGHLTKEQVRERTDQVMADEHQRAFVLELARTANHSGPRRPGYDNDVVEFEGLDADGLDRISAPTLLVHGLADSDVEPEQSRTAAAAIPGSDLVEPPGGTHLACWIHPDSRPVRDRAMALLG